jgi:hypothetical protein
VRVDLELMTQTGVLPLSTIAAPTRCRGAPYRHTIMGVNG